MTCAGTATTGAATSTGVPMRLGPSAGEEEEEEEEFTTVAAHTELKEGDAPLGVLTLEEQADTHCEGGRDAGTCRGFTRTTCCGWYE